MGGIFSAGTRSPIPGGPLAPAPRPAAPDAEALARKAQLDAQLAARSSSSVTNTGGALGIATDPSAQYKAKSLLGS